MGSADCQVVGPEVEFRQTVSGSLAGRVRFRGDARRRTVLRHVT